MVFFPSLHLNGQIPGDFDTIRIKEIVIGKALIAPYQAGYKRTTVDSSVLVNYNSANLSDLLLQSTGIYIKSYGMGGIATPSFRGTGASHTLIDWNGININSPMLGQSDLSIIPAGLLDDVQIYYGGGSMSLNSGGIGGIINLETKPQWKKETVVSFSPSVGSFGQFTGLMKVKAGNMNFQTVTKAFIQSSENDFRYLNTEAIPLPIWETRTNSQVHQKGFMQEVYYSQGRDITSVRIWYQSARRNLSPPLEMQDEGEKQSDESLRTMLNYEMSRGKNSFTFTGAYLFTNLNYTNQLAKIDSRNAANTVVMKALMESIFGDFIKYKLVLNNELSLIKTNNYAENQKRNTVSATTILESMGNNRLGATLLFRETLNRKTFLMPDFSAGFQYRIFDEKEYYLKANISRNSKIPSLNDMFWSPGGNPGLKNEYAYIYELTYLMNQTISALLSVNYDLSVFHNSIKDMIQWVPGEYSYWTPSNLEKFNTTGLESSLSVEYNAGKLATKFTASYSYIPTGKQLVYMPESQAKASLVFSFSNIYSTWSANMANSGLLPGYFINKLIAGYKMKINNTLLDLNFNIDNLFDTSYQTMAHYPLPGRFYTMKLLIQFTK